MSFLNRHSEHTVESGSQQLLRKSVLLLALLLACASVLSLNACSSGGGDSDSSSDNSGDDSGDDTGGDSSGPDITGQREFTAEVSTDGSGLAGVDFSVPIDTTKVGVVAFAGSAVRFTRVSDSRLTDYLTPGGLNLSLSTDFTAGVSNVTAPSRSLDPALDPNESLSAVVEISPPSANQSVQFQVITKADSDLQNGVLRVNTFRISALTGDPDVDAAVNAALEEFRSIYSASAGIQVVFSDAVVDGPPNLPFPFDGDALYQQLSQSAPSPAVNLVLGGSVQGLGDEILGISGGIPGPPVPSIRSAVAVSLITGAGPDGVYSESEINVLAETMAHEVGHFMGLFHPIELEGGDSDPLTDTPTCSSPIECETNPALAMNLMFPTPVADSSGGVLRQNQISGQQRGVLNRYIAVD